MTSEDIRKIAEEEMAKQIRENIDSALIFKYVSDLEAEIEKKDKLIDLILNTFIDEVEFYENMTVEDLKEYFINKVEKEN